MRIFFSAMLGLAAVGCGGAETACVPGESSACTCDNGKSGAQSCGANHTFQSCVCNGSGTTTEVPPIGDSTPDGGTIASGADAGDNNVPPSTGQKRVFVTSTAYKGGAAGGACQNAADAVNLGGKWTPWLSSVSVTIESDNAIDDITGTGPWVMLDGEVAFNNHAQLATLPLVPLTITEMGTKLPITEYAWTGTLTGGSASGESCYSWSSDSTSASIGVPGVISEWTDNGSLNCGSTAHVYCFEQ